MEEERRRLDVELLPERGGDPHPDRQLSAPIAAERTRQVQGAKAAADEGARPSSRLGTKLRAAKDAAMMQYREANLRVRTDSLPRPISPNRSTWPRSTSRRELPEYVGDAASRSRISSNSSPACRR